MYNAHNQKTRLKITQLEKERFIKMNKLKLTQVDFFFHFMCVAANASELFCMTHLAHFSYYSNLSF